jgi:hypothetical protein
MFINEEWEVVEAVFGHRQARCEGCAVSCSDDQLFLFFSFSSKLLIYFDEPTLVLRSTSK